MLLLRDLRTARALVESGADVPAFTLGGLHYAPGRTKLNDYVYLDEADREDARVLLRQGVKLEVQDVPAARPQALTALDPSLTP
jgi:mannose/fructose/N-acetylgalactosamine-specific phosphotransferase system component IIB